MDLTPLYLNLRTGESYIGRLAITGNHQIYLPKEIQQMLKDSGKIRIQILRGWCWWWSNITKKLDAPGFIPGFLFLKTLFLTPKAIIRAFSTLFSVSINIISNGYRGPTPNCKPFFNDFFRAMPCHTSLPLQNQRDGSIFMESSWDLCERIELYTRGDRDSAWRRLRSCVKGDVQKLLNVPWGSKWRALSAWWIIYGLNFWSSSLG